MPDRGNVIRGLEIERECVSRDCDRECGKCDLAQDKEWLLKVYDDALELLREQEPRVLTFDELMALPHMIEDNVPVVSEVKYPVGVWTKGTLCKWRGAEFLQELVQDHKWYNREHYGKIWRVWTAIPSIEQRKAVKWDD